MIYVILLFLSAGAFADAMNLNEFFPTRLEDSSPIDEKTIDAQFSSNFEEDGPRDQVLFRSNLRYGINRKAQVETQGTFISGGDETGSGDLGIGGLYQFNEADDWTPTVSFSPLFVFLRGKENRGEDLESKFIISSALLGTRLKIPSPRST